jgi:hypothetical protein
VSDKNEKAKFVPNLINAEPPALLGLTLPEVVSIVGRRVAVCCSLGCILGLVIYTHVMTATVGFVLGLMLALMLTKRKATKVLDEGRGKDPFYSQHKDAIAKEELFNRLADSGLIKRTSEGHRFQIEDGFWSQR